MSRKRKEKPTNPYCTVCGKPLTSNRYGDICQSCYVYFKTGKTIHPLPPKGEIRTDEDGDLICHICGKAYGKLGSHIALSHGITAKQYKKRFGIAFACGLCKDDLKDRLRELVEIHHDQVVVQNLVKKGEPTRFKKGSSGRTKNMVSLQTYRQLKKNATRLNHKTK